MLHIILDSGDYDVCSKRHGSPLTVALDSNCFDCIEIMSKDEYKFDYQEIDGNGISFIGYLV